MATLLDYCALVRSKNAGPFVLTFDFMCRSEAHLRDLVAAGVLTESFFADRYGCTPDQVRIIAHPIANALKITLPRYVAQGDVGESDNYSGQLYAPLMEVELPET